MTQSYSVYNFSYFNSPKNHSVFISAIETKGSSLRVIGYVKYLQEGPVPFILSGSLLYAFQFTKIYQIASERNEIF